VIAAVKQPPITTPGQLVIGYARVGDGDPPRLSEGTEAIAAFARQHKLLLGTVFTDRDGRVPAMERPAFRALLDVVRYVPPSGLVLPTIWHLSNWENELNGLSQLFASLHCRIFTTRTTRRPSVQHHGQYEGSQR
jgi:hypothetical protein